MRRRTRQPRAARCGFEEPTIAFVHDHRADVSAAEEVVDTGEAAQLPCAQLGHVADIRVGHRVAWRCVAVDVVDGHAAQVTCFHAAAPAVRRRPVQRRERRAARHAGNAVAAGDRHVRSRARRGGAGLEGVAVARVEPGQRGLRTQVLEVAIRPADLHALALRAAHVLERGAAAAVGECRDLVAGARVEHGGVEFAQAVDACLHAGLDAAAARRVEPEVQARGAVRAVGQLIERGRLEAAPSSGVQVHARAERVHQADGRQRGAVGGAAAVVFVDAGDVGVCRVEAHAAVAHTGVQRPRRRELPCGLCVLVEVRDVVALVAPQHALHAERGADEVLKALALLAELVVGHAGDQREGRIGQGRLERPAHVGAAVVARQHDHAAGLQGAGLRGQRDRLELHGVAVARIRQHAQHIGAVDLAFVDRADLRLIDRLARVEGRGRGVGTARVGLELRARQAQRVLRLRQVHAVGHERELARLVGLERELEVADLALHGAVVAPAVAREPAEAADVAERTLRARHLGRQAQRTVAARRHAEADLGRPAAVFGEDLDHAAGRVAVERRERPAQHLDAASRAEVDVRDLALPIGQRGGNAVDIQAHTAHAEGRARAEAAHRDLHVLRVVLPVARQQARYGTQALGDVDLQAAIAQGVAVDPINRRRHVERLSLGARGGHDDR